jgi:hypothetical protein
MEAALSPDFCAVRFARLVVPFSGLPRLDLPPRRSP